MFVFPMLGRSSRFFNAGFKVPKYKLPLGKHGQIVFDHVVNSFKQYFETDLFVIVSRADTNDKQFLIERLQALGVKRFKVLEHQGETRGQAESVELALKGLPEEEELYIFNIDTILFDFKKYSSQSNVGGYLEVFRGEGKHWSFVEPNPLHSCRALRVVEKERISELCSNGLYFFKSTKLFKDALSAYLVKNRYSMVELYVAPIYNELIERGININFIIIPTEQIGFCGVPDEYFELYTKLKKSDKIFPLPPA
jgi:dTDP-glucose pyrophosphorylase